MAIRTEHLSGPGELGACVDLQRAILGDRARTVWAVPALTAVEWSGGLVLGARDGGRGAELCGALVDLVAEADGYPARHTVFRGVRPSARNRGVAQRLRAVERSICHQEGVDLVFWSLDPLRSNEAHIALNKLGAIATGHVRNLYGEVHDAENAGLPTDRLRVEWWVDSPRVASILDRGNPAPHFRLGIHRMDVVTDTRLLPSGVRTLAGFDDAPTGEYVLAEIPVDLDRVRSVDPAAARAWRRQSRGLFDRLFETGYVGAGFVHEAGRSFHLFRRADRRAALTDA